MSKLIDLTGKTFGNLKVIERSENKGGKVVWKCQCKCGNIAEVKGVALRSGQKSCGCCKGIKDAVWKEPLFRRSHSNKLFHKWRLMLARCTNDKVEMYQHYGGRGIFVCEEWSDKENGFENFTRWAIENGYPSKQEIDRIDNDREYSPQNCRFVSHQMNSWNRGRRNKKGIPGVNYRKSKTGTGGSWRATIMVNGKNISLGTYADFEDAKEARRRAELQYWGQTGIE